MFDIAIKIYPKNIVSLKEKGIIKCVFNSKCSNRFKKLRGGHSCIWLSYKVKSIRW